MLALLTTLAPGFASTEAPPRVREPAEPVTNFEKYLKTLGDSAKEVTAHMNTPHFPPLSPSPMDGRRQLPPPVSSGVGICTPE